MGKNEEWSVGVLENWCPSTPTLHSPYLLLLYIHDHVEGVVATFDEQ
jgi:hypothetical protein